MPKNGRDRRRGNPARIVSRQAGSEHHRGRALAEVKNERRHKAGHAQVAHDVRRPDGAASGLAHVDTFRPPHNQVTEGDGAEHIRDQRGKRTRHLCLSGRGNRAIFWC